MEKEQFLKLVPDEWRDRINRFTDFTETCLVWRRSLISDGYGQVKIGDKKLLLHRLAYVWVHGDIPEGFFIDHVKKRGCVSKACFNPARLEAVTPQENFLRAQVEGLCVCGASVPVGKKSCATCKKDFERARKRRYGNSKRASRRAFVRGSSRQCVRCLNTFEPKPNGRIPNYCSRKCRGN